MNASEQHTVRQDRSARFTVLFIVYCAGVAIFPSNYVLPPLGASGYVSSIMGVAGFGLACCSALVSNPANIYKRARVSPPIAITIIAWTVSVALSYAVSPFRASGVSQLLSGDRFLLLNVACGGTIIIVSRIERNRSRVTLIGIVGIGAFTSLVAVIQWLTALDPKSWFDSLLPGFVLDAEDSSFVARGDLIRVTGTAINPIELSVIVGMLLPACITLLLIAKSNRGRALATAILLVVALGLPASVSRSGILVTGTSVLVWCALSAWRDAKAAIIVTAVGSVVIASVRPGFVSTIAAYSLAGANDPSVEARLQDYQTIGALTQNQLLLGSGGGTYAATDALTIFDNEYLTTLVDQGLLGLACLILLFAVPAVWTARCAFLAPTREERLIAAAVSAAITGAAIGSTTFDSLSFGQFTAVFALTLSAAGFVSVRRRDDRFIRPDYFHWRTIDRVR